MIRKSVMGRARVFQIVIIASAKAQRQESVQCFCRTERDPL
jgi:hypothetical protein